MKTDRYLAARLLSKKEGLSAPEKEEILAHVVGHHSVTGRTRRGRGAAVLRLAMGTCALVLIVAIPVFIMTNRPAPQDEFLARGGQPDRAAYAAKCLGARGETDCVQGNKLIFEVTPPSGMKYFAAFARAQDGTIVWYFPGDENTKSINVQQNEKSGVLSKGILLGPEHRPGSYELYGIFSATPQNRAQIRSYFENNKAPKTAPLIVLKRKLTVGI